jgi:hypothetical protein
LKKKPFESTTMVCRLPTPPLNPARPSEPVMSALSAVQWQGSPAQGSIQTISSS